MPHRYCPDHGRWLDSTEYEPNHEGEQVCPAHSAVHGFIHPGVSTVSDFYDEHPEWYDDRDEMLEAAIDQGLIER